MIKKPSGIPYDPDQNTLSGWTVLFVVGLLITIFAYFSVDLVYIPEEWHLTIAIVRLGFIFVFVAGLVLRYVRPQWILDYWRWMIRVISGGYYVFLITLESLAEEPARSRYCLGMLLVAGAFLIFRISREHSLILGLATIVYAVVNRNSPIIGDAIFDLVTFGMIYYAIIRNYLRIENSLEESLMKQREIIATINHGWIVPFRAISRLANALKSKLEPRDRDMAETIEYQARFMHTEAKELIDLTRESKPLVRDGEAGLREVFTQCTRVIEFIKQGSVIEMPEPLPDVTISSTEEDLFRIIVTLLSNSMSYSPDQRTRVEWARANHYLILDLTNRTKRALSEDMLFRKYKSAEPGGTGIGLYNVRSLIEALGGRIEALLSPDSVTFRLELPEHVDPEDDEIEESL